MLSLAPHCCHWRSAWCIAHERPRSIERGKPARFVKRFADIGAELRRAAVQYAEEVAGGVFPADEHCF